MSYPTCIADRPTVESSHVRAQPYWARRTTLLVFAALSALAACSVDERTIAPADPGDESEQLPGAGGTMGAGVPTMPAPMPVDTDEDSEGNPDPSGMLAGGGSPREPGTPSPTSPTPTQPAPAMAEPLPQIVNGRVIDFYRRPMPNVAVTIGGTTVATNAQGQFRIAGVQAPYDASMIVTYLRGSRPARAGYVYEGLTRADPTLQAVEGLPERSTDVTLFVEGNALDPSNQRVIVAFGGPEAFSISYSTDSDVVFGARWSGPATFSGTLRQLLVTGVAGTFDGPVLAYEAQEVSTFGLSDGIATSMTLSIDDPVSVANLSGSVNVAAPSNRVNAVGLRFADGTRMALFEDREQTTTYSYLVPNLQGATLSVTAINSEVFPPYAAAHRDNIAAGQGNITLDIPNAVTLSSPTQAAEVARDTPFVWSSFGQTATTFVWRLEFLNTSEYMYVVTQRTSLTLPSFADGFTLAAGAPAFWSVETHGDIVDVDAAAGPVGYMDPMAIRNPEPVGPNTADGYFTESERRDVTFID